MERLRSNESSEFGGETVLVLLYSGALCRNGKTQKISGPK